MVQRDYVSRGPASRRKQQTNTGRKKLLLVLILVIVLAFLMSLFFLKENSPVSKEVVTAEKTAPTPKSTLPSRPEEVWSYIKQLETREVPVDDNAASVAKNAQLTEEQKKILQQLERDKLAEQARQKAEEQARAKAAEQQKAEQAKASLAKNVNPKPEKNAAPTKSVVIEAKAESDTKKTTATESKSSGRKYGLQCGAFKNKTQAENLQGRLVLNGFNAFTKSSADWTRVFIGPLESYNAASGAKSTLSAKGVDCVVIGM